MSSETLPVHCFSCGKEYKTLTDFIGLTTSVENEPALIEKKSGDQLVVQLVRLCSCGSEVLIRFQDRRDTSERGEKKRALFDRIQQQLMSEGVEKKEAHSEILNLIYGRPCPVMKALAHKELFAKS